VVPQQGLLTEAFASALKSDNWLAFIFTSYLKFVKAVPQQVLLTVKWLNGGRAEGKNVTPLFEKSPSAASPISRFGSAKVGAQRRDQ
jgi:hypothetical protein